MHLLTHVETQEKDDGLKNILISNNFVHNLGVLYDALIELSDLSI